MLDLPVVAVGKLSQEVPSSKRRRGGDEPQQPVEPREGARVTPDCRRSRDPVNPARQRPRYDKLAPAGHREHCPDRRLRLRRDGRVVDEISRSG